LPLVIQRGGSQTCEACCYSISHLGTCQTNQSVVVYHQNGPSNLVAEQPQLHNRRSTQSHKMLERIIAVLAGTAPFMPLSLLLLCLSCRSPSTITNISTRSSTGIKGHGSLPQTQADEDVQHGADNSPRKCACTRGRPVNCIFSKLKSYISPMLAIVALVNRYYLSYFGNYSR
jgi:hypothetical protein